MRPRSESVSEKVTVQSQVPHVLALICLLELPITLQENKPRSLLKVLNLSCDPYSVEKEKKDPGNNLMTVACLVAKHRRFVMPSLFPFNNLLQCLIVISIMKFFSHV